MAQVLKSSHGRTPLGPPGVPINTFFLYISCYTAVIQFDEIFALLGYYVAYSGNSLRTFLS